MVTISKRICHFLSINMCVYVKLLRLSFQVSRRRTEVDEDTMLTSGFCCFVLSTLLAFSSQIGYTNLLSPLMFDFVYLFLGGLLIKDSHVFYFRFLLSLDDFLQFVFFFSFIILFMVFSL